MKPDLSRPILPGDGPRWAYASQVEVGDRVTIPQLPHALPFTVDAIRMDGMVIVWVLDVGGEYYAGPRAVVIINRPGVAL